MADYITHVVFFVMLCIDTSHIISKSDEFDSKQSYFIISVWSQCDIQEAIIVSHAAQIL